MEAGAAQHKSWIVSIDIQAGLEFFQHKSIYKMAEISVEHTVIPSNRNTLRSQSSHGTIYMKLWTEIICGENASTSN